MSLLSLKFVSKNYGGIKALSNINLDIEEGEVHSIVGENGAGKSTMMKIISGVTSVSEGEIYCNGIPVHFKNSKDAEEEGICIIHQEPVFFSDLTVLENIFIGKELKNKLGIINWSLMKEEGKKALEYMGLSSDILNVNMGTLPIGLQQMILIAKGVYRKSKILILDEPTSILSYEESERLFKLIRDLSKTGVSVIYISHRIPEILELSKRISVLKDGVLVATLDKKNATGDKLLEMMSGRVISKENYIVKAKSEEVIFEAQNVSSSKAFNNISFKLRKGEILGLYGLVGAGRTEIAEAIIGERAYSGRFIFNGSEFKARNAKDAYKKKIVYLPEDRITEGVFPVEKILINMTAGLLNMLCKKGLFFNKTKERHIVNESVVQYAIKIGSVNDALSSLSGGNQQKVLFTRCLLHNPDILILDEPTRGIDVKTKSEIYRFIKTLLEDGTSVILISSELPEIMVLTSRVYVMHEGNYIDELKDERCSEENILKAALNS